ARSRRTRYRGRADDRYHAAGAAGRIEAGQAAARNDPAGCEAAILVAEAQIVGDGQILVGEIGADEPVEMAVQGRAVQPQFLAERLEFADDARSGAIEDVDRAIV